MLFPQSFIRVWFFWESRLQHQFTWWLQVLWTFWIFLKFCKNFEFLFLILEFWNLLKILIFFWKFWNFFNFIIFKFFENFLILWNFLTLISKKQFLCNKKPYCALVPGNFIHWFCARVQYDYLLHRNCSLLINMLENGMSRVLLLANRKTVK